MRPECARLHRRAARAPAGAWSLALAWLLAAVALCCGPAAAQPRGVAVAQVEAAFLVNFLRYTDWPPQRFASATEPYRITVVGSADVASTVAAVATAAGVVRGRRILVRHVAAPDASAEAARRLRDSHLAFLDASAGRDKAAFLRTMRGLPVLTVADVPGFAAAGGMLGLVRSDAHLAFEANPEAIRAGGIRVSAQVLKLARIRGGMR